MESNLVPVVQTHILLTVSCVTPLNANTVTESPLLEECAQMHVLTQIASTVMQIKTLVTHVMPATYSPQDLPEKA